MIAKDHLSDRVFFFERSSPINLTVYAYKLNNYEYESTFFEKKDEFFFLNYWNLSYYQFCIFSLLFMFLCLFGVYHPTWEFFTHAETSPIPVKGCNIFRPKQKCP